MDLDQALDIVNDPSAVAYCRHAHESVYRIYGQYEQGFDARYDEIAEAFAFVAVEAALDAELFQFVFGTQPERHGPDTAE